MRINMPSGAESIINTLQGSGFDAYAVGGCVRDALMGKTPNDWDITTNASPSRTKELFAHLPVIDTGIAHGTVTVIADGEKYEVTTFRADGEYTDHRHPDRVSFARDIEDDLSRRDFTVNAMAYNHTRGVIDLFGGREDIKKGIIRTVGDPKKRFSEDALRILRGLRFASCLGFKIHADTQRAMNECKALLSCVAGERRYEEISKLIMGDGVQEVLTENPTIIAAAMPEAAPAVGFDQRNTHHIYDVWEHTARTVANCPKDKICRLVMLLHDLGKPSTFSVDSEGTGHFYGHAAKSALIAEGFFARSGESSEIRQRVCRLVSLHDSDLFASEKSIKRWLGKLGEEDLLRLVDIKRADNLAQAPAYRGRAEELEATRARITEIARQKHCVAKSMLSINGNDVKALGFKGAEIGRVLGELLEAVIDERCANTKDALLSYAKQIKAQH